jgi:DNA-binding transcriptional ArsR family regulator
MKTHAVDTTLGELEARAEEVAATLDAMANPKRLVVMCTLMSGERSVGELAELVNLSPAALSQHLGKMRALLETLVQLDAVTKKNPFLEDDFS